MNKNTVIGLNGKDINSGFYISLEDIEFAESYKDGDNNQLTRIFTKAGQTFVVLGNAYYILDLKQTDLNRIKNALKQSGVVFTEQKTEKYIYIYCGDPEWGNSFTFDHKGTFLNV